MFWVISRLKILETQVLSDKLWQNTKCMAMHKVCWNTASYSVELGKRCLSTVELPQAMCGFTCNQYTVWAFSWIFLRHSKAQFHGHIYPPPTVTLPPDNEAAQSSISPLCLLSHFPSLSSSMCPYQVDRCLGSLSPSYTQSNTNTGVRCAPQKN